MNFKRKPKLTKKCPRCGNKCLINQTKCEECDLLFSRLEFCSNKAAKKKLLHFDKDFIIYTNQLPKDVQWWKILILSIFTGLLGGHYYYVGKFFKAGLMSASFVYLVFCTIFNPQITAMPNNELFFVPIGIYALAWLISLVYVLTKKFKVPVIVEIPEFVQNEMKNKKDDFEKTKSELENENRELKDQFVEKNEKI